MNLRTRRIMSEAAAGFFSITTLIVMIVMLPWVFTSRDVIFSFIAAGALAASCLSLLGVGRHRLFLGLGEMIIFFAALIYFGLAHRAEGGALMIGIFGGILYYGFSMTK